MASQSQLKDEVIGGHVTEPANVQEFKDCILIEKEEFIQTMKPKLVATLSDLIISDVDKQDFVLLCSRVESTVRAWYSREFEEMTQLYALFNPVGGRHKLEQQNLSPQAVEHLEEKLLDEIFKVMEKSGFRLLSDQEYQVAMGGRYLIDFPINVDRSKLDSKLLARFYKKHYHADIPKSAREFLIFRRGIGEASMSDWFVNEKFDMLLHRAYVCLLELVRIRSPKARVPEFRAVSKQKKHDMQLQNQVTYRRSHIEHLPLSPSQLLKKTTIYEPTFEHVTVIYRPAVQNPSSDLGNRDIQIMHFRDIPMADLEIVLPEKKMSGLSPQDTMRLVLVFLGGLYALYASFKGGRSLTVIYGMASMLFAYFSKVLATWRVSIAKYQNLLTRTMYDKHLDSGAGTLLLLSNEVIQQEVKEVILAYFVLMTQGKATKEELDERCEELLREEFKEEVEFDVEDAVDKLKLLNIVKRDAAGFYTHQSLKKANEIIGMTTEELVGMHDV